MLPEGENHPISISDLIRQRGCKNFQDMKYYIELWIWDLFASGVKSQAIDEAEFKRQLAQR